MSQMEGQTLEIDGVQYHVLPLPPDDAIRIGTDIMQAGGEAIFSALASFSQIQGGLSALADDDPEVEQAATQALSQLVSGLISRADANTYLRIIEGLMKVTMANGQPMHYNGQPMWKLHFQGKLGRLRKVVTFAIKVNFADFFAGGVPTLTSAIGLFQGATAGTSKSQAGSAGGSGA